MTRANLEADPDQSLKIREDVIQDLVPDQHLEGVPVQIEEEGVDPLP